MLQLGISAFYHDSAAAIVRDGEVIAAAKGARSSRPWPSSWTTPTTRGRAGAAWSTACSSDISGAFDRDEDGLHRRCSRHA